MILFNQLLFFIKCNFSLEALHGDVIAKISTSGIDNTGYNHHASVPITISNVPNTFITAGTLSSNTDWQGCVMITGDITVPSGITLTIHPNSIITFQNNSSLTEVTQRVTDSISNLNF